jgi:hypothetical protein
LRSIQAGHRHIGDDEIDSTLNEARKRFLAARKTRHAVASGFQHDFAVGKGLLVIVYTQNSALGFHQPSAICRATPHQRVAKPTEAFLNMKNVRAK